MEQHLAHPAAILTATAISGHFPGLLGEIAIAQTFHNPEAVPIEAVFTFPVPVAAVLLEVEVEIDERRLQGRVLPAAQAEADYEDAITDGDGAILLQEAGRGLYTLNVGNLLPGQAARLRYRYALLGDWDNDRLRLLLPTTLAPRYGDPLPAGLAPHQVPETALSGARSFTLDLELSGGLGQAQVRSTSHPLAITVTAAGQRLGLAAGAALMDRDLILDIRAPAALRAGLGLSAPDREGGVALVSVQPPFPASAASAGRDLVLVADASGSMAGDSIAHCRTALAGILDRLTPADRFNLIAFGSQPEALFMALQAGGETALARARARVANLEASLGGTELGAAMGLAAAQRQERPLDILLITDGEVWEVEPLLAAARQGGNRFFTVGVGAAVAAPLVRDLATVSGGACALVHPQEDMAAGILRHFERLRAPVIAVAVTWPAPPLWSWPDPIGAVFAGDSLHLLAGFTQVPVGTVTLRYTLATGEVLTQHIPLTPWPEAAPGAVATPLARLAAARRLAGLAPAAATALAVAYQLVSPHTHYLLVERRATADQAQSLPELRTIPHLLAAGWGGSGRVAVPATPYGVTAPPGADAGGMIASGPGLLAGQTASWVGVRQHLPLYHRGLTAPAPLADWLLAQAGRLADPPATLPRLDEWAAAGLPASLVAALRALVASETAEEGVVIALLIAFISRLPAPGWPRAAVRRLRFLARRQVPPDLAATVQNLVATWTPED